MNSMKKFVLFLQSKMLEIVVLEAIVFVILGSVIRYFKYLKPTVPIAVFLMILQPMFVMDFSILFREWKRKAAMLVLVIIIYSILYPLITWGFFKAFQLTSANPYVLAGAVITTLTPVAMPVPIVVASLGGDVELSVLSIIVTFLASLIVIPTWSFIILHKAVPVPVLRILKAIGEFIVLPLIVGRIIRYAVDNIESADFDKVNLYLIATSLCAIYYLIALVFALSASIIVSMIYTLALFMLAVYTYYAIRHGVAYAIGKAVRANRKELITLTFVGTANGALGMAISLGAYGPAAAAGAVLAGPLGVLVMMSLVVKVFKSKGSEAGG